MEDTIIQKVSAPESVMDHTSPKTTQAYTLITGFNYTPIKCRIATKKSC